MALTITIEGKGVIANADAISDTAGGTWTEQGGGTIAVSNDVYLINGVSIGGKYASKSGFHQYDIGAGNELDFSSGGTEEGELIYFLVSMTALGTLDTKANYGLCLRVSSSSPGTTNYLDYLIAGNDDTNGWNGRWKVFALDVNKTPTRSNGTQSSIIASVRTLGIWIDCSTSARADSIFTDMIIVGSGLRVTGTSTTGIKDVVDYVTDYSTRGWPVFEQREGIYYQYGGLNIGDAASQTAAVSFTDSGRKIQSGLSEYWTGSVWASSMSLGAVGINIEDHTSYTTTFSDGVVVGTDAGRSGSNIIGNANLDVSLDLYGGNNTGSVTTLYGTTIEAITGVMVSGNDADHKAYSINILKSDQYDPVGAQAIRNATFAETTSTASALLWNANIDIQDSQFIANTTGAATEFATVGTYSMDNLIFSGNTYDVLNSDNAATITAGSFVVTRGYKILTVGTTDFTLIGSADNSIGTKFVATGIGSGTGTATEVLVINKTNGANPATANNTGTNADTLFVGSVPVTIAVLDDSTGLAIANTARVTIQKDSDKSDIDIAAVNASGIYSYSYTGSTPLDIVGWVREQSLTGTDYTPKDFSGTIDTSGFSLTVRLVPQV